MQVSAYQFLDIVCECLAPRVRGDKLAPAEAGAGMASDPRAVNCDGDGRVQSWLNDLPGGNPHCQATTSLVVRNHSRVTSGIPAIFRHCQRGSSITLSTCPERSSRGKLRRSRQSFGCERLIRQAYGRV